MRIKILIILGIVVLTLLFVWLRGCSSSYDSRILENSMEKVISEKSVVDFLIEEENVMQRDVLMNETDSILLVANEKDGLDTLDSYSLIDEYFPPFINQLDSDRWGKDAEGACSALVAINYWLSYRRNIGYYKRDLHYISNTGSKKYKNNVYDAMKFYRENVQPKEAPLQDILKKISYASNSPIYALDDSHYTKDQALGFYAQLVPMFKKKGSDKVNSVAKKRYFNTLEKIIHSGNPLIFGTISFQKWQNIGIYSDKDFEEKCTEFSGIGAHALMITGFHKINNNKKFLEIVNVLGDKWCMNGRGYLDFNKVFEEILKKNMMDDKIYFLSDERIGLASDLENGWNALEEGKNVSEIKSDSTKLVMELERDGQMVNIVNKTLEQLSDIPVIDARLVTKARKYKIDLISSYPFREETYDEKDSKDVKNLCRRMCSEQLLGSGLRIWGKLDLPAKENILVEFDLRNRQEVNVGRGGLVIKKGLSKFDEQLEIDNIGLLTFENIVYKSYRILSEEENVEPFITIRKEYRRKTLRSESYKLSADTTKTKEFVNSIAPVRN